MDVGVILSRSFSLYKRNTNLILPHLIEYLLDLLFLLLFGIFAAIVLALSLGSVTTGSVISLLYGPTPFLLMAFAIFAVITLFLIFILFNAFARAAIIGMVIEAKKDGKTSLNTGFKSAKRHGFGIFGYMLVISIVPVFLIGAIIFAFVAILFSAGLEAESMGLASITLIIFIMLLSLFVYIIIYVLALFSPQKIVIEELGVLNGIRASFGFVRKHLKGVVLYLGVVVAVVVLTSLVSVLFALPATLFRYVDYFIAVFFRILENIASITLGLLVAPYLEAVKTLIVLEAGGEVESEVEESSVL